MANERARQLRANQTRAERTLWRRLREMIADGFHFRRQAPIGNYVVDFVCHTAKSVIEVDGGQHGHDRTIAHDESRTAWLAGRGYRVIRFWNNDVIENLTGIVASIRESLESPPPTGRRPTPHWGVGIKRPVEV